MPQSRVYQATPLQMGETLSLSEKATHHIARVLRAKIGDSLILFNGEGGEYQAKITAINKKAVIVNIIEFTPREAESPISLFLAQGIARGEKMDFIVQKAVELGVQKIFPLLTERSNVKLDDAREKKRLQHWESIAISACEQSGRNRLPTIFPIQTLSQWLDGLEVDCGLVLSPFATVKLSLEKLQSARSIAILIGPEGGLSEQEVILAERKNLLPLNLGPRILRTETASIAALSILQAIKGDMTLSFYK